MLNCFRFASMTSSKHCAREVLLHGRQYVPLQEIVCGDMIALIWEAIFYLHV